MGLSGKKMIKRVISNYFMIVTLINIAMYVLGSIFRPDQQFSYEVMLAPLVYGALSLLPVGIMYSKKELSVKQLYLRKVLQLLCIELILYLAGYGIHNVKTAKVSMTVGFGLSVFFIYVLVDVLSSLLNVKEAKELTELFQDYQARQ